MAGYFLPASVGGITVLDSGLDKAPLTLFGDPDHAFTKNAAYTDSQGIAAISTLANISTNALDAAARDLIRVWATDTSAETGAAIKFKLAQTGALFWAVAAGNNL